MNDNHTLKYNKKNCSSTLILAGKNYSRCKIRKLHIAYFSFLAKTKVLSYLTYRDVNWKVLFQIENLESTWVTPSWLGRPAKVPAHYFVIVSLPHSISGLIEKSESSFCPCDPCRHKFKTAGNNGLWLWVAQPAQSTYPPASLPAPSTPSIGKDKLLYDLWSI